MAKAVELVEGHPELLEELPVMSFPAADDRRQKHDALAGVMLADVRDDLILGIYQKKDCPGWGYMVEQGVSVFSVGSGNHKFVSTS